jgi:hypothetical protein
LISRFFSLWFRKRKGVSKIDAQQREREIKKIQQAKKRKKPEKAHKKKA